MIRFSQRLYTTVASDASSLSSPAAPGSKVKGLVISVFQEKTPGAALAAKAKELADGAGKASSPASASVESAAGEDDSVQVALSPQAIAVDTLSNGLLSKMIKASGMKGSLHETKVFYGLHPEYPRIAVVGLGSASKAPESSGERTDKLSEPPASVSTGNNQRMTLGNQHLDDVRLAAAAGARALCQKDVSSIAFDIAGAPQAVAEGAALASYSYNAPRQKSKDFFTVNVELAAPRLVGQSDSSDAQQFARGRVLAEAQNMARTLMETSANMMTPLKFVDTIKTKLQPFIESKAVRFNARGRVWAEGKGMGAFLSVSNGSEEPLQFLEVEYRGAPVASSRPLVLVGKGITFDSGGISIKPSSDMGLMRGDMGGAAVVMSTLHAIATLKLPVNVVALAPLCENMPSGRATKPGDIVRAMNGKTIEVDNTDAEGRLILADALVYASSFNPDTIIDVATLTGAIDVALGQAATGLFSTSDDLAAELVKAGELAGDHLWRMPLFPLYSKMIKSSVADIVNSTGRGGGACTAAAFLKEFVTAPKWAHLDIAGVMHTKGPFKYLPKGMTGRPTRALIEFATEYAKKAQAL